MIPWIQTAQDRVRRQQVTGKGKKTAVRTLANALPQGRLGHLGMVMPPITDDHATTSRMLPVDQTLYT